MNVRKRKAYHRNTKTQWHFGIHSTLFFSSFIREKVVALEFCKNYWWKLNIFLLTFDVRVQIRYLSPKKTLIYRFLRRWNIVPTFSRRDVFATGVTYRLTSTLLAPLYFSVILERRIPQLWTTKWPYYYLFVCYYRFDLYSRGNGENLKMPRDPTAHKGRHQFKRRFSLQPAFFTREEHSPVSTPNHRSAR